MEQLAPAEKVVLRDLGAVVSVRSSQRVLLMGVSILNAIAAAEFIQLFDVATAGAVTLGKLNMTELAMGPFGDNAHHGDVQNPWKAGHCAGGSSSGSAAAVAAQLGL